MMLLKHWVGRIKRGSRGQDLNQHGKGETSDNEQRDAQTERAREVDRRQQSCARGWCRWPELALASLALAGEERAVAARGSAQACLAARSALGQVLQPLLLLRWWFSRAGCRSGLDLVVMGAS